MAGQNTRSGDAFRLMPLVMAAGLVLLFFKGADKIIEFTGSPINQAQAQEAEDGKSEAMAKNEAMSKDGAKSEDPAVMAKTDTDNPGSGKPEEADVARQGYMTKSEREVLESLSRRRIELDKREEDLQFKKKLLLATEKQISQRLGELKKIEARIEQSFAAQEERKNKKLSGLVTLYENMKPQSAARIFDRLDMEVLISVAGQIKPRKMAVILAAMSPDVAEKLTLEMAMQAGGDISPQVNELPKVVERNPS